ncbi:histidine kinase [Variovorax sp. J22R133]|uniref:histidine kinase n=1 Tax=Variovorax brevis TaxID=3053503 RepID=UPI0025774C1C|nr:histidine kinase [Variovorax sp. J22R133]MDM0110520.1 histidine kinase [Variovorax sp. J22R133]
MKVLFQPHLFELWGLANVALAWGLFFAESAAIGSALIVGVAMVDHASLGHPALRIAGLAVALVLPAQVLEWVFAWGFSGNWVPASLMSVIGEGMKFSLLGALLLGARTMHRRMQRVSADAMAAQAAGVELERQAEQAQLQLLQAQIEPHFLFNTLANVRRLYRKQPAAGAEAIADLLVYLRAALPQLRRPVSTLGEEFELVRSYLKLFKMRMGPRLQYALDLPPPLRNVAFPTTALVTLVENAVKHGLSPADSGGMIHVGATRNEQQLEVTVIDDGVGFCTGTSGSGLGLVNIRRQLQARFGDSAQLTLEQADGCGVCARIIIPRNSRAHMMVFGMNKTNSMRASTSMVEIQRYKAGVWLACTLALVLGCGFASAILSSFTWPHPPAAHAPAATRIGSFSSLENWLRYFWSDIVVGMLAVVIANRWRARDREIENLTTAQEMSRVARQRLVQTRLLSIQTRIDPQLVFDMLATVKRFYECDAARAERLLDDLTAFLRAALRRLRSERSSLEVEFDLIEAYAQLLRIGLGRQISLRVGLPDALKDTNISPALLLPLITHILESSGPEVSIELAAVKRREDATCVRVLFTARLNQQELESMRAALVELYGNRADMRLQCGDGPHCTVELEVPYEHG